MHWLSRVPKSPRYDIYVYVVSYCVQSSLKLWQSIKQCYLSIQRVVLSKAIKIHESVVFWNCNCFYLILYMLKNNLTRQKRKLTRHHPLIDLYASSLRGVSAFIQCGFVCQSIQCQRSSNVGLYASPSNGSLHLVWVCMPVHPMSAFIQCGLVC